MNSKSKMNGFSTDLLTNKTALVTGAGKGIGRVIAHGLVTAGADVIAVARTEADIMSLQAQLGESLKPWVIDAASDKFLNELTDKKFDILVNNMGTNRPAPFTEISELDLDVVLDLNIRSVFRVTQKVVAAMQRHKVSGSIVNISSQMGHVGSPNRSVYCVTKHAIEGLTKALGVELAADGIRVNSVAPTFVETPMTKPMLEKPEFAEFVYSNIPLNRLASCEEVANAVVFLASDLASSTTGSCLKVDGGWTAQ